MNDRVLVIDYHKCVGCGTCQMICSLVHEGICSSDLSRIRVARFETEARFVPISCAFCEKAPCISVCPSAAIFRNNEGAVLIDDEKCIGCRQCVQACPFGHMNFNSAKGIAYKCDLCDGDPQCVKFCWTNAIQFLPAETAAEDKRYAAAGKIME